MIEPQGGDGRAADRGPTDHTQSVFRPSKVFGPHVRSRIEQPDDRSSFGIRSGNQIPLKAIARGATEPKVHANGRSLQGAWPEMFEFQSDGQEILRHKAITTALASVSFNLSSQLRVSGFGHWLASLSVLIQDEHRLGLAGHEFMNFGEEFVQFQIGR